MAAMVTALEQAIAKQPQGLLVVGFEPSLNAIVDKAVDAGIPVVTVDADLPGSSGWHSSALATSTGWEGGLKPL